MMEKIWQKLKNSAVIGRKSKNFDNLGTGFSEFDVNYSQLSKDTTLADQVFDNLRRSVFEQIESKQEPDLAVSKFGRVFLEHGRLEDGRRYFYMKPSGQPGWLFERSGVGWIISHSEKIVEQGTFLRSNEPWDIVTLHRPHLQTASVRIKSFHLGDDALSYPIYKRFMIDAIADSMTLPPDLDGV